MNLAVNALDAMPSGGKLIIETRSCDLDESYASTHADVCPQTWVLIAVTDTGCGMPKETLEHMFEPFFTTKEPGKGTGLGLATVYGIVKQSHGHITVYSEPGHRAAFKVYFPSLDKSAPRPTTPRVGTAPKRDGTVLLAEDEAPLRVLAAESLKRLGYTVLQAGNGLEAARSCRPTFRQNRCRRDGRSHATHGRSGTRRKATTKASRVRRDFHVRVHGCCSS
jgi:two-component system, cell cycle sensor histidine kinase and response regulator CckA